MQYESGNVILSDFEKELVRWVAEDAAPVIDEPMSVVLFLSSIEKLKQQYIDQLIGFEGNPAFIKKEMQARALMKTMISVCDELCYRLVAAIDSELSTVGLNDY